MISTIIPSETERVRSISIWLNTRRGAFAKMGHNCRGLGQGKNSAQNSEKRGLAQHLISPEAKGGLAINANAMYLKTLHDCERLTKQGGKSWPLRQRGSATQPPLKK